MSHRQTQGEEHFRLVVDTPSGERRFLLHPGENLVGAHESCEIRIDEPTISRFHAVLVVTASGIHLSDLGSENGTFVDGRSVEANTRLLRGARLTFAALTARLEGVQPSDARVALASAGAPVPRPDESDKSTDEPRGDIRTLSAGPLQRFLLDRLPTLTKMLADGAGPRRTAIEIGEALVNTLGASETTIRSGEAVWFRQVSDAAKSHPLREVRRDGLRLQVAFARPSAATQYVRLLEALVDLLASASSPSSPMVAPPPNPSTPSSVSGADVRPPDPPSIDPQVREIYRAASRVAQGSIHVLVLGGSGVGKEVLARFIHRASARSEAPFVALNCAALPTDLLEAELFGIERGVATGVEARAGVFENAHGGTLFLDEIGDMALSTQARILRVLQEGEVHRLGGSKSRPADARVISATNRDIKGLLEAESFRSDLYHRIADWVVTLPDLRDRAADIPQLASYFLEQEAKVAGKRVQGISEAALDALCAYPWPGNIRQLEREIARAVLFLDDGGLLDTRALSAEVVGTTRSEGTGETLKSRLARFEADLIRRTLAQTGGDVAAAAKRLSVPRSTLYRRIAVLDLDAD